MRSAAPRRATSRAVALGAVVLGLSLPTIVHGLGLHPTYEGETYDLKGKRALVLTTSHDGFARLCPFLGMDHGPCSGELGAFPRATFTEEKKQRHGQVGHGRRLNSCFCRKAFKEIGRESNSTDDDDDNAAVEAPAVEAPTSTSSTSSTKKKALPVFALTSGTGPSDRIGRVY